MKLLMLGILVFAVAACHVPAPVSLHDGPNGLRGGVKEPTYPPDGPINCWVQPPHDEWWYPCPQKSDEELGKHGH